MARDGIEKSKHDLRTALLDAMMLAASADGHLTNQELEQLIARAVERSEFEGTRDGELKTLVEASAARLASAPSLEQVLASLRERLGDHRNRLLAFSLACAVALADSAAKREELGLLKTMQAALGISEDEVLRVFETVQRGGSLDEVVGEPVERAYAEVMVMVSASDGAVEGQELEAMLEAMAGDPVFHGISVEVAERSLREAAQALARQGVPARLGALSRSLAAHVQRTKAYSLAARVAWAEGAPAEGARRVLSMLQAHFGLADDEVKRLTQER